MPQSAINQHVDCHCFFHFFCCCYLLLLSLYHCASTAIDNPAATALPCQTVAIAPYSVVPHPVAVVLPVFVVAYLVIAPCIKPFSNTTVPASCHHCCQWIII